MAHTLKLVSKNENSIPQKYSCLLFCEGRNDRDFVIALRNLDQFQYHTQKWRLEYDVSSGGSIPTIIGRCHKSILGRSYDLVLCLLDIDQLKRGYPKTWAVEAKKIETANPNLIIIWQLDKLEDEYKKVLAECGDMDKYQANQYAKRQVAKFVNSDYWHRILDPIKAKEVELDIIKATRASSLPTHSQ